eukprot:944707-Amphidinium_carterae.2
MSQVHARWVGRRVLSPPMKTVDAVLATKQCVQPLLQAGLPWTHAIVCQRPIVKDISCFSLSVVLQSFWMLCQRKALPKLLHSQEDKTLSMPENMMKAKGRIILEL